MEGYSEGEFMRRRWRRKTSSICSVINSTGFLDGSVFGMYLEHFARKNSFFCHQYPDSYPYLPFKKYLKKEMKIYHVPTIVSSNQIAFTSDKKKPHKNCPYLVIKFIYINLLNGDKVQLVRVMNTQKN